MGNHISAVISDGVVSKSIPGSVNMFIIMFNDVL